MSRPTAISPEEQEQIARRIGVLLLRSAPEGWQRVTVEYRATGEYHDLLTDVTAENGDKLPFEAPAELRGIFAHLREGMYRPDIGTWLSATYVVDRPSSYRIDINFDAEPEWNQPLPRAAYVDELRRYPRSDENIPDWMRARLDGAAADGSAPSEPAGPGDVGPPDAGLSPSGMGASGMDAAGPQSAPGQPGRAPMAAPAEAPLSPAANSAPAGSPAPEVPAAPDTMAPPERRAAEPPFAPPFGQPASPPPPAAQVPPPPPAPVPDRPAGATAVDATEQTDASGRAGSLRIVDVFDSRDEQGRPVVTERKPIPLDDVVRLRGYLENAPIVLTSQDGGADELGAERSASVPATWHTDGTWLWPGSVAFYLAQYGVPPQPEFVEHIRGRGFTLPEVDDRVRDAAMRQLADRPTGGEGTFHESAVASERSSEPAEESAPAWETAAPSYDPAPSHAPATADQPGAESGRMDETESTGEAQDDDRYLDGRYSGGDRHSEGDRNHDGNRNHDGPDEDVDAGFGSGADAFASDPLGSASVPYEPITNGLAPGSSSSAGADSAADSAPAEQEPPRTSRHSLRDERSDDKIEHAFAVLHDRLSEHDLDPDSYRIGSRSASAMSLVQEGPDWVVYPDEQRHHHGEARFSHPDQATAYLLGTLLLNRSARTRSASAESSLPDRERGTTPDDQSNAVSPVKPASEVPATATANVTAEPTSAAEPPAVSPDDSRAAQVAASREATPQSSTSQSVTQQSAAQSPSAQSPSAQTPEAQAPATQSPSGLPQRSDGYQPSEGSQADRREDGNFLFNSSNDAPASPPATAPASPAPSASPAPATPSTPGEEPTRFHRLPSASSASPASPPTGQPMPPPASGQGPPRAPHGGDSPESGQAPQPGAAPEQAAPPLPQRQPRRDLAGGPAGPRPDQPNGGAIADRLGAAGGRPGGPAQQPGGERRPGGPGSPGAAGGPGLAGPQRPGSVPPGEPGARQGGPLKRPPQGGPAQQPGGGQPGPQGPAGPGAPGGQGAQAPGGPASGAGQAPGGQEQQIQPLQGEPPLTLYRDRRRLVLQPGTDIDRFGEPGGNVTYAIRTPYGQRSLPPQWANRSYYAYRVQRPVQVLRGTAVPWFEQVGGGTAYVLPASVADLVADGTLIELTGNDMPRPAME